jgi:MFS family permease
MDPRANWLLLANAALGNFLAGTASRIFAVSLPTVAASLDTTIVGIAWAVIAYQISQISLSLIFGRIGDIYGRHTLFGLGLVVSSIGALLCGLSQNVTQLILFRMFQGVGASMAQSQGRALAMEALPKESSGRHRVYDHGISFRRIARAERRRADHRLRSLARGVLLSDSDRPRRHCPDTDQLLERQCAAALGFL